MDREALLPYQLNIRVSKGLSRPRRRTMRLLVRRKNVALGEELQDWVEMRMRFAFSRFHARIREIVVTLDDLNGPKGGVDKRCRVVVRMAPRGRVAIEEIGADFETAVARAAERGGRTVGRELERRRDARTSGPGMSPPISARTSEESGRERS
jgi:hypothetical protein